MAARFFPEGNPLLGVLRLTPRGTTLGTCERVFLPPNCCPGDPCSHAPRRKSCSLEDVRANWKFPGENVVFRLGERWPPCRGVTKWEPQSCDRLFGGNPPPPNEIWVWGEPQGKKLGENGGAKNPGCPKRVKGKPWEKSESETGVLSGQF